MKPTLRDLQTRFTAALLDGDLESIAPFVQTDGIEAVERLIALLRAENLVTE